MFILNLQSREPIYEQLYKNVVRLTALGVLSPDQQLPPVRALASELGVNPNTVSKAYQNLEKDGIIYSATGRGSFISSTLSAIAQQKTLATNALRSALQNAWDLGVTKEEITNLVKTVFQEMGKEG